jgi:predicted DNA-binding protein (UPF0251 family)
MEEQLHQSHPQQDLVHQHPAQVLHQPQAGVPLQQHQAALVAVQELERQRLKSLQDLVESPPL